MYIFKLNTLPIANVCWKMVFDISEKKGKIIAKIKTLHELNFMKSYIIKEGSCDNKFLQMQPYKSFNSQKSQNFHLIKF